MRHTTDLIRAFLLGAGIALVSVLPVQAETETASSFPIGESVEVAPLAQNEEGKPTFSDIEMEVVDGTPVIVYADAEGIHEARWNGSGWMEELVTDRKVSQLATAMVDGKPAIVYCDTDGDWLRYSERTADGWETRQVAGDDHPADCREDDDFGRPLGKNLALASIDDSAALAYQSESKLIYAEHSAEGWQTQVISRQLQAGPDLTEYKGKSALVYSAGSGERSSPEVLNLALAEPSREGELRWNEWEIDRMPSDFGQMYHRPRLREAGGKLLIYYTEEQLRFETRAVVPRLVKFGGSSLSRLELPGGIRGYGQATLLYISPLLTAGAGTPERLMLSCVWLGDLGSPYSCGSGAETEEKYKFSVDLFTSTSAESALHQRVDFRTIEARAGSDKRNPGEILNSEDLFNSVTSAGWRDSLLMTYAWEDRLYSYLHPAIVSAIEDEPGGGYSYEFHVDTPQSPPASGVEFEWDFNGDGSPDITTGRTNVSHDYRNAGMKRPEVSVEVPGGTTRKISLALPVSDYGNAAQVDSYGDAGVGHSLHGIEDRPVLSYGVKNGGIKLATTVGGSWIDSWVQETSSYSPFGQTSVVDSTLTELDSSVTGPALTVAERDELSVRTPDGSKLWTGRNECVGQHSLEALHAQTADLVFKEERPALLTYRKSGDSPELEFFRREFDGEWTREAVFDGFEACSEVGDPSLKLVNGQYAVAFRSADGLHYATRTEKGWNVEQVPLPGAINKAVKPQLLKLDDQPVIVLGRGEGRMASGYGGMDPIPGLYLAVLDEEGWQAQTISGSGYLSDAAVVWDQPVICFHTRPQDSDRELKLARRTNLGWQFRTLDANRGGDCSITQVGEKLGVSSHTDYTDDLVYWEIGREEW